MKLIPVLTEKSLMEAKNGKYSFWVSMGLNKLQIKGLISQAFGVTVLSVRTINSKKLVRRNARGRYQVENPNKKAIVKVKAGEKISLFEEEGKGKK